MNESAPIPYRKVEHHSAICAQVHDDWYELLAGAFITETNTLHHNDTLHERVQYHHKWIAIASKHVGSNDKQVVGRAFRILRDVYPDSSLRCLALQIATDSLSMWIKPGHYLERAEEQVRKQKLFMIYREREVEMGRGVERSGMQGSLWAVE
ncbi:uncharacterized protein H6S33_010985 [Morchella sextelata]|uniref:uncharacterized protein n=1 Tax=Morchella sextelata TaxID=1174677 RepID=UPI001D043159|nr:uncharacterized protein H6S33_010985 [Morchella sextelata]KAH0611720.1 hypothetical protein H6S33_010985 [Morchella sextelata]